MANAKSSSNARKLINTTVKIYTYQTGIGHSFYKLACRDDSQRKRETLSHKFNVEALRRKCAVR